jgi:hypothetical protein
MCQCELCRSNSLIVLIRRQAILAPSGASSNRYYGEQPSPRSSVAVLIKDYVGSAAL